MGRLLSRGNAQDYRRDVAQYLSLRLRGVYDDELPYVLAELQVLLAAALQQLD